MIKNHNFGQTSKVCQKLKFWSKICLKIEILVKN